MDIPDDWEGWGGAVGAWARYGHDGRLKLTERPRPGGVVGIYNAVPAEFIVGVNGVTPKEYTDGLEFWDEHIRPR